MRRSSNAVLQSQTSEPLIVVEESGLEPDARRPELDSRPSSEDSSPTMNPYLLSPYSREIRKHSLPTPQCSGITASQVRRLSERGETAGPGPRQAEFLATLSSAPAPSPGGRRHSVVTISKVPPSLFGRSRRESAAGPARILPNRRESIACPPSTEARGSVHNLQLDIMDDIVQARKVRMKLWTTSSERVCEVQPLDEGGGGVQRYNAAAAAGRRFSDFVGTTLAPIPSGGRRGSELPPTTASKAAAPGIVCSNTDLISILSSLAASSTDVNHQCEGRRRAAIRSSSFDAAVLKRQEEKEAPTVVQKEPGRVVWDGRSGSMVDAHALGSAIEGFLRQATPETSPQHVAGAGEAKGAAGRPRSGWFAGKGDGDAATETCDSSICATLKDLFVK